MAAGFWLFTENKRSLLYRGETSNAREHGNLKVSATRWELNGGRALLFAEIWYTKSARICETSRL